MSPPEPSKRTEASQLTDRLRAEIVGGAVQPGTKLKLVPLAERFGVSRGPLREAATRLAAEGLVTIEDQRGFRVSPVSRADLLDLTATRQRIESLALRDAMEHGDLDWEGRVLATCHMLARVTAHDGSPEARERFRTHHAAFHAALVSACPSRYLLRFRDRLYGLTDRYRNLALTDHARRPAARDIVSEHQALAEATVGREADLAVALLTAHLQHTADTVLAAFPQLFEEP